MASTPPVDDGLAGPALRPIHAFRRLLIVAIAETITLAVLVINVTIPAHNATLAAAIGPVHGLTYLAGVLLTWLSPVTRSTKVLSVVPLIGIWNAVLRSRSMIEPEPEPETRQGPNQARP